MTKYILLCLCISLFLMLKCGLCEHHNGSLKDGLPKYVEFRFDLMNSMMAAMKAKLESLDNKVSRMMEYCDANDLESTILMQAERMNKNLALMEYKIQEQLTRILTKDETYTPMEQVQQSTTDVKAVEDERKCWTYPLTGILKSEESDSSMLKTSLTNSSCSQQKEMACSPLSTNCSDAIERNGFYSFHWLEQENHPLLYEIDGNNKWLVIQQRGIGQKSTSFNRSWEDYKWGFGDICDDFWIGNKLLHELTQTHDYSLKIEFLDANMNAKHYAFYDTFKVSDEDTDYSLHVNGFRGKVLDGLRFQHGQPFTTYDHATSYDLWICSILEESGWWFAVTSYSGYSQCNHHLLGTNLNAPYKEFSKLSEETVSFCNESSDFKFKYSDALYWRGNYLESKSFEAVRMKIKTKV